MSDSLRTVIIQELRTRFPNINWKLGSMVRELIVEPLSKLGDIVSKYLQEAESRLDISAIKDNPTKHKDTIDLWMNKLGLTGAEGKESSGTIAIMSETGESMTILADTLFTWGDGSVSLISTETTTWGDGGAPYIKYGEGAYMAEIKVASINEQGGSLSSGAPVNWDGAPSHVYDIYTKSPITGGRPEQSYQEKANMIMDAMSVKSLVGEECIASALRREFPGEIVDAAVLADKDISETSSVTLCIKPFNPPGKIKLTCVVMSEGDGSTYVEVNNASVTGVVDVIDQLNIPCPIESITKQWVDGSSSYTVKISGAVVGDKVTVNCVGFDVIARCSRWLQQSVHGLPFHYKVVAPYVNEISIYIPTTDYISPLVATDIQSYVNSKPLDSAINDSELANILSDYGITLNGTIVYSNATTGDSGKTSISTTIGGADIAGCLWAGGRAVAMYTYLDKIKNNA